MIPWLLLALRYTNLRDYWYVGWRAVSLRGRRNGGCILWDMFVAQCGHAQG
jgi:hypothetical protein